MAGKQPRQGWIYTIDTNGVSFKDKKGDGEIFHLDEGGFSYLVWKNNKSQKQKNTLPTLTVIPLTSKTTWVGLPIIYPITATKKNLLSHNLYALIHQISIIDGKYFQNLSGNWLPRIGQLDKNDKERIEERLSYYLSSHRNSHQDWFKNNTSRKLLAKVYEHLQGKQKEEVFNTLLDEF